MSSPSTWGLPPSSSRPGGGGPNAIEKSSPGNKEAVAGPGRCLFAVVVPPKDLDPEDVRAHVKSALASVPPQYHTIEHEVGAVVFLGDGTPVANAGPAHSPQVLERPECVVILVSPQLDAAHVAEAFVNVCDAHSDPKRRAVGLKMKLRELSGEARFSFVLLDLATARVFCASTSLSSPLAMGHASDGTLLVTCTRSGARAATAWPPRWTSASNGRNSSSSSSSSSSAQAQAQQGLKLTHQYGQSPGGGAPLTPGRSISPATDRSRSRSPSACSTHSSGSGASEGMFNPGSSVTLNHLPAGRFVYGRRYLQPFEFSAFWHSAETNRAGARAASIEAGGEEVGGVGAAGAGAEMGSPPSSARSPNHSPVASGGKFATPPTHPWSGGGGGGGGMGGRETRTTPGSSDRRKYSSTGSRSDTSSTWRKKTAAAPTAEAERAATPPHASSPRGPSVAAGSNATSAALHVSPLTTPTTPKSEPMAVPKMNNNINSTWPPGGYTSKARGERGGLGAHVNPEALMLSFAAEEHRRRSTGTSGGGGGGGGSGGLGDGKAAAGKWVPRGRWTQGHHSSSLLQDGVGGDGSSKFRDELIRSALSEELPRTPRRGGRSASELTRALSQPQVALC